MNHKIKIKLIYLLLPMKNPKTKITFLSKTKHIKYIPEKQEIFIQAQKESEIDSPVQIWDYLNFDCFLFI